MTKTKTQPASYAVQVQQATNRKLMLAVFDFLVQQDLQVTIRGVHIPTHLVTEPWGVEVNKIEDFERLVKVHEELKERYGCTFISTLMTHSLQVITLEAAHLRRVTGG
jgi:hypothetical protein